MHHPWRAFRHLVDWTLHWSHDLPEDRQGEVDFEAQTVTIAHGLTQAERRCTIAHETQHILRGPAPAYLEAREERAVNEAAARLLIPVEALAEALLWSYDEHEVAEELWVDVDTVQARLAGLTADEQQLLNERLDAGELELPVYD